MDAQQFAYWLNGFAELSGDAPPTAEQWKSIKEHLALVFTKVTPPVLQPQPYTPIQPWTFPKSPTCAIEDLPPLRAVCSAVAADDPSKTYVIC